MPRINIESNKEKKYHLTPKGYALFKNFLSSSILFEIYRDEFAFEETRYDIRCSREMSQEQLFLNYLTYIEEFWDYECRYIRSIEDDELKKEDYVDYFGETVLSLEMINGLKASVEKYYGEKSMDEPLRITKQLNALKSKIEKEGEFGSRIAGE